MMIPQEASDLSSSSGRWWSRISAVMEGVGLDPDIITKPIYVTVVVKVILICRVGVKL